MIRSLVSGSILLPGIIAQLLADEQRGSDALNPLAPKAPHFPGKAKRVIFLYMTGGVSHVDSFDPKPRLIADAGKPNGKAPNSRPYLPPFWTFKPRANCGTEVSDLFPYIGECMDDICLIRSMHGDHNDHFQATLGIHTGSVSVKRPSIGSWVSYGLGTVNQNLPSFVVLAPQLPYAGSQVWGSDFLPGCHQGTRVLSGPEPIPNLNRLSPSAKIQQRELNLLDRFNRKHQQQRSSDPTLAARIKSFETAFGMQMEMPSVLDISKETDATLALYGLERGSTKGFGWQCLVARRMAERGVRFIELIDVGSSNNWDAHGDMKTHGPLARNIDKPIAGLLKDLKSRGMLDDTLVVWTTEFGRTPFTDGPTGRSHQNSAYSSWLAGGGVKGGVAYGKTDDYGAKVVENEVHVHDFHASVLHLLGFNHEKLTFRHGGRDFRLTDVSGKVVKEILA
ncbi:MAG TPA: DUF1501 domain-containing protein [Acidobacteriota bacterium]|jgi:hypothetical protein|nr:DUF1501 domain-containing protein [Acidobacteriota bacterium]